MSMILAWIAVGIVAVGLLGLVMYQSVKYIKEQHKKLLQLTGMIEDWFFEIERTFDEGLDADLIDKREMEIDTYLKHKDLRYEPLKFSKKFRMEFIKRVEATDRLDHHSEKELFGLLTKCPDGQVTLQHLWNNLKANYRLIYNNYVQGNKLNNFDAMKRQILLLKMYREGVR